MYIYVYIYIGRVQVGDVLLCLTNKKRHPITTATSIEYIKKKIMGAPRTTCTLSLLRNGAKFDVDLTRGGFSQPVTADTVPTSPNPAPSTILHTVPAAVVPPRGVPSRVAVRGDAGAVPRRESADTRMSVASEASRSSGRSSAALLHTCGVGLLLCKDAQGNTLVEGVAPGGPADVSGQVMVGDVVLALKNKKLHVLTTVTSLDYVKRKVEFLESQLATQFALHNACGSDF